MSKPTTFGYGWQFAVRILLKITILIPIIFGTFRSAAGKAYIYM
jgi:hypothetical protein